MPKIVKADARKARMMQLRLETCSVQAGSQPRLPVRCAKHEAIWSEVPLSQHPLAVAVKCLDRECGKGNAPFAFHRLGVRERERAAKCLQVLGDNDRASDQVDTLPLEPG